MTNIPAFYAIYNIQILVLQGPIIANDEDLRDAMNEVMTELGKKYCGSCGGHTELQC